MQVEFEEKGEEESGKKTKKIQKDQEIRFEKITVLSEKDSLVRTQYGNLLLPKEIAVSKLSNIYYLVNSSNINYIMSILFKDTQGLILFPSVGCRA